jgi:hypothetical protein
LYFINYIGNNIQPFRHSDRGRVDNQPKLQLQPRANENEGKGEKKQNDVNKDNVNTKNKNVVIPVTATFQRFILPAHSNTSSKNESEKKSEVNSKKTEKNSSETKNKIETRSQHQNTQQHISQMANNLLDFQIVTQKSIGITGSSNKKDLPVIPSQSPLNNTNNSSILSANEIIALNENSSFRNNDSNSFLDSNSKKNDNESVSSGHRKNIIKDNRLTLTHIHVISKEKFISQTDRKEINEAGSLKKKQNEEHHVNITTNQTIKKFEQNLNTTSNKNLNKTNEINEQLQNYDLIKRRSDSKKNDSSVIVKHELKKTLEVVSDKNNVENKVLNSVKRELIVKNESSLNEISKKEEPVKIIKDNFMYQIASKSSNQIKNQLSKNEEVKIILEKNKEVNNVIKIENEKDKKNDENPTDHKLNREGLNSIYKLKEDLSVSKENQIIQKNKLSNPVQAQNINSNTNILSNPKFPLSENTSLPTMQSNLVKESQILRNNINNNPKTENKESVNAQNSFNLLTGIKNEKADNLNSIQINNSNITNPLTTANIQANLINQPLQEIKINNSGILNNQTNIQEIPNTNLNSNPTIQNNIEIKPTNNISSTNPDNNNNNSLINRANPFLANTSNINTNNLLTNSSNPFLTNNAPNNNLNTLRTNLNPTVNQNISQKNHPANDIAPIPISESIIDKTQAEIKNNEQNLLRLRPNYDMNNKNAPPTGLNNNNNNNSNIPNSNLVHQNRFLKPNVAVNNVPNPFKPSNPPVAMIKNNLNNANPVQNTMNQNQPIINPFLMANNNNPNNNTSVSSVAPVINRNIMENNNGTNRPLNIGNPFLAGSINNSNNNQGNNLGNIQLTANHNSDIQTDALNVSMEIDQSK